jgi:hypothetical protein
LGPRIRSKEGKKIRRERQNTTLKYHRKIFNKKKKTSQTLTFFKPLRTNPFKTTTSINNLPNKIKHKLKQKQKKKNQNQEKK